MNCSEIPKGWEKCEIGDATHAILASGVEAQIKHIGVASSIITVGVNTIMFDRQGAWDMLGITPVRKVQPIEFTVTATIDTGQGAGAVWVSILVDNKLVGKTFREVIE